MGLLLVGGLADVDASKYASTYASNASKYASKYASNAGKCANKYASKYSRARAYW